MIQAKCVQKFRDKNGKIYGYRLQDLNGQTQDVKPENLKQAISNNQLHVINLKLTSDNRLVDSSEKGLSSSKLGDAPQRPMTQKEMTREMYERQNFNLAMQIVDNTNIVDISHDFIEEGTDSLYNILTTFLNNNDEAEMEMFISHGECVNFKYSFTKSIDNCNTQSYGFEVVSKSINMPDIVAAFNKFEEMYNKYKDSKSYIISANNKEYKFKSLKDTSKQMKNTLANLTAEQKKKLPKKLRSDQVLELMCKPVGDN